MQDNIRWLLDSEPWVEYRTRLDLLKMSEYDKEVVKAKEKLVSHPQIGLILSEFKHWNEEIVSNHKSAGLLLHKLSFLADIGLTSEIPAIQSIINTILQHRTESGIIQVPISVPIHFGGTGQNTWGWCLCDAPIVLYSLIKFGMKDDPLIKKAIQYFIANIRENGWGCTVSPELGKFRGPGRKDDPCPYATLLMLKVLSQVSGLKNSIESHIGVESLLNLWVSSKESHPYMFYMGTDFRKLKAPLIWYDIVHVVDVLSQFEWLKNDTRLLEMISLIKSSADENGCYTPQSEWKAWKNWDFGQKKKPSQWLTFLVLRILSRVSEGKS